tara:strand:- start:197 stop:1381 length:1185 start_codon:yes stop_codon:yes gene_type:complete
LKKENFLYFNLNAGVSGDMLIASLIDLGVPLEKIIDNLKLIDSKISINAKKVNRGPVQCVLIEPLIPKNLLNHKYNWKDLFSAIEPFKKNLNLYKNAKSTLDLLKESEEEVHGDKNNNPHELGSIDTIFDIIGFYSCIDYLNIKNIFSSAVPFSQGNVSIQHGIVASLAPVSLNLVKKINIPVFGFNEKNNFEFCTPTGLSLLKNFKFHNFDSSEILNTGFGAGNADMKELSNSISVSIMRPNANFLEKLSIIETNIDDMSPEIVPYLMERIFQIGAKDVWCSNILMKKNRPAIMISVLCNQEIIEQVVSVINKETSTFGLRISSTDRIRFNRSEKKVSTEYGEVRVKLKLSDDNDIIGYHPEYEDCKNLAKMHNIPLKVIFEEAIKQSMKMPR